MPPTGVSFVNVPITPCPVLVSADGGVVEAGVTTIDVIPSAVLPAYLACASAPVPDGEAVIDMEGNAHLFFHAISHGLCWRRGGADMLTATILTLALFNQFSASLVIPMMAYQSS